MSIRGGGARVSAWPACRTENGSAASELRCRSASAASWSGSRADPTEYKVAARTLRPIGGLSSVRLGLSIPLRIPPLSNLTGESPYKRLRYKGKESDSGSLKFQVGARQSGCGASVNLDEKVSPDS